MAFKCSVCGIDMGFDRPSGLCSVACRRKVQGEPPLRFVVEAEVCSADGGSDASYHLCDTFTAEELLAELAVVLKNPVLDMLLRGSNSVGHVLRIEIRDAQS